MKIFSMMLLFLLSLNTYAGTCTSISRTNSSPLSVLTSTKYNADHNTAYSAINSFDGGCVQTGTLEFDALNTTQFAPILSGTGGCKVNYLSASSISISKCREAVNGSLINTAGATTASFGCSGCSSEVASTSYYVYIQTGSSGSTLTPLILTTSPNDDGYDNTGNKVIGRFYNNASSDIDRYSIDQWNTNDFRPQGTGWVSYTPDFTGFGTPSGVGFWWKRRGSDVLIRGRFTSGVSTATEGRVSLPNGLISSSASIPSLQVAGIHTNANSTDNSKGGFVLITGGVGYVTFSSTSIFGSSTQIPLNSVNANVVSSSGLITFISASIPVTGWND
jgi:hypothetical protein